MPANLPGGSAMWLWGRWFTVTEVETKVGWVFTMHEALDGQWREWFSLPYHHFSGGWSRCRNRARKALLEGARPELIEASSELKALHEHWQATGRHALMHDNPHHDHYGLSGV